MQQQQQNNQNQQDPDVIILGAGPVGLWTAINILKQDPSKKVTLFERYQTYVRANMINLCDPAEVGVTQGSDLYNMFAKKTVSILEVENTLQNQAKALGANIVIENVNEFDSLLQRYPNTKRFIACDGAHSKVRTKYYGPTVDNTNYFNCVQVAFETKNPRPLTDKQKKTLISHIGMMVEETMVENKVFLRFFATDDMFETVKQYVFKTPCDDLRKVPHQKLQQAIATWLKFRAFVLREVIDESSFRLICFKLGIYRTATFSHIDQNTGRVVALCGDSAFGVPFYRSMRNGFVAANIMTKYLFEDGFVDKYNQEMEKLYKSEKARADGIRDSLVEMVNSMKSVPYPYTFEEVAKVKLSILKDENEKVACQA